MVQFIVENFLNANCVFVAGMIVLGVSSVIHGYVEARFHRRRYRRER